MVRFRLPSPAFSEKQRPIRKQADHRTDLAIKCATHSGSYVGRKIWGRVCLRPIPLGFHAFHKPDFPPAQIHLCVAGFMTRFASERSVVYLLLRHTRVDCIGGVNLVDDVRGFHR